MCALLHNKCLFNVVNSFCTYDVFIFLCVLLQAANLCLCAEISCGPPLNLPYTNPLWDGSSRPGSVVLYECMAGFYPESEANMSTCLKSGEWEKVSVKCQGRAVISSHGHN